MGKKLKYLDKPLLVITIFLFIIGLVMVFSASNVTAYMTQAVSPYYYFRRQALFLAIGFAIAFVIFVFNTNVYGKLSHILLLANIGALIALTIYGSAINDSVSWFEFGFGTWKFTIQPSEFIKVISIVFLAEYYDSNKTKLNSWVKSLLPMIICAIIAGLIVAQPDLGTGLIYMSIVAALFFASPISKEIRFKVFFAGVGGIAVMAFVIFGMGKNVLQARQMERFDFRNPCDKILDNGNQVCNSYIAMNNGGLTGVGLGNSTQKYLYLPEPYTDFIFAIIVEEGGVLLGVLILLAYMFVLYRILRIGRRTSSNRGALLCYGVAIYIFAHIAVNLLGIMGLMPMTGVPLPFMSYGGSFTICLIAALTMVQRVNVDTRLAQEKGD